MRHHVERKRLNRDSDHRKALLMNLSQELIKHGKIETTLVKAKYLKPHFEQLVTKAKEASSTSDKVRAFNILKQIRTDIKSEDQVKKLITETAPTTVIPQIKSIIVTRTGQSFIVVKLVIS